MGDEYVFCRGFTYFGSASLEMNQRKLMHKATSYSLYVIMWHRGCISPSKLTYDLSESEVGCRCMHGR